MSRRNHEFTQPSETAPSQQGQIRPLVIVACLASVLAGVSPCTAQETFRRFYPTAPTSYRPQVSRLAAPVAPHLDRMNAEADIPQSHLLYSLHAPPLDSVIRQTGGELNGMPDQRFGVVRASGQTASFGSGPAAEREPPFEIASYEEPMIEHIAASPSWTHELSLSSDLAHAWSRLRDDTVGVLHPNNVLILALAGGGTLGLRQDADKRVREYTARHEGRWGNASDILGEFGYINVQLPALLGTYFWSLHTQNEELHDVTTTTMSAFTINGFSTLVIKAAANTSRPSADFNGGQFGFPSYHAASSFTVASVLDEYYGHRVGIPAYTFAGLIAWSRIDERDHDLSDVVFGSVMGFVIGKSVARQHLTGDSRVRILPWFEAIGGTTGLQLSMVY